MQCLSGFELHSRWVPLIEVVISQFPPKCKTSNVFLTITWFFSDFIKYLGDVNIRLSLDWVKYLYISWSGKWRFFAYTVACYTVHISFFWFRRNRAGPSCNIFINPLECVFVRNRGGKWRGSACILFEILISRHNSKKEFEPVSVCFAVSFYICIPSGHNTII